MINLRTVHKAEYQHMATVPKKGSTNDHSRSENKPGRNKHMVKQWKILGHKMNHKTKKTRKKKKKMRLVQDQQIQVGVIVKAVPETHQSQVLQNQKPPESRITRKGN
jgi:hypothetical protein